MNKLFIGLLATSTLFAMDEYKPMDEGKTEIDLMYNHKMVSKGFDKDGKAQDKGFDATAKIISFGAKYGITAGLDVELLLPYAMTTTEHSEPIGDVNNSGLANPELGIKYAATPDIALFLNTALPFGSKDIVGDEPVLGLKLGAYHYLTANEFSMISGLSLGYSLEDGNKNQEGMDIDILLKPSFAATPELQVDLGIKYNYSMEKKEDGKGLDNAGNLLTIAPGVQYMIDETMAVEVNVGIDVMGKNADKALNVYAGFYYNM